MPNKPETPEESVITAYTGDDVFEGLCHDLRDVRIKQMLQPTIGTLDNRADKTAEAQALSEDSAQTHVLPCRPYDGPITHAPVIHIPGITAADKPIYPIVDTIMQALQVYAAEGHRVNWLASADINSTLRIDLGNSNHTAEPVLERLVAQINASHELEVARKKDGSWKNVLNSQHTLGLIIVPGDNDQAFFALKDQLEQAKIEQWKTVKPWTRGVDWVTRAQDVDRQNEEKKR